MGEQDGRCLGVERTVNNAANADLETICIPDGSDFAAEVAPAPIHENREQTLLTWMQELGTQIGMEPRIAAIDGRPDQLFLETQMNKGLGSSNGVNSRMVRTQRCCKGFTRCRHHPSDGAEACDQDLSGRPPTIS